MTPNSRRLELDALRVFAIAFLILYHVGMFYVTEWDWHIKSAYLADWLQFPMRFVNRWRMDLVFLVSGMALALLLQRRTVAQVLKERTVRLFVPLVFGMWFIIPIQPYAQGVTVGAVHTGYLQFLVDYFGWSGAKPWPAGSFDGANGVTWTHLWFLPYLLIYSLLVAWASPLLERAPLKQLGAWFDGLTGWQLLLLPIIPFVIYMQTLWGAFPDSHDLFHDWFLHATYFTVFVYGVFIARGGRIWERAARLRKPLLLLALGLFVVYSIGLELIDDAEETTATLLVIRSLRALYMWTMLLALLGWARHLFSGAPDARPVPLVSAPKLAYLTEAVFPWYVLHQSLIILIGFKLTPFHLGPVLEPTLVLGGTVAGCVLLHEFVIRRTNWLRPLFGVKRMAPRTTERSAPPSQLADDMA